VSAEHWDGVYRSKPVEGLSWFQTEAERSMDLLRQWAVPPKSLIDIGAGASSLADSLLDAGWPDVTLLDVSERALDLVRARLGSRASMVGFEVADVVTWWPRRRFDAWHDRAVFHFLVDPADREHYVAAATEAVPPGGVAIIGTFAPDGPSMCSGLPTQRYAPDEMATAFAAGFHLEHAEREVHPTPGGATQAFSWVVLRRRGEDNTSRTGSPGRD
jgi:2-polyprenyl-3-methyl-5-hydroxy-6-metoxy-1,4-benzoquinol methylase